MMTKEERKQNKAVKAEAAGSLDTESRNFLDVEASVSGLQDGDSE